MTTYLTGCKVVGKSGNVEIKNIDPYIDERFNIPKGQPLPSDHYEFKPFLVVGDFRIGKTQLTKKYFADRAYQLWRDTGIDFFNAKDIYGSIEAVAKSKNPIHFTLLDDQVFYLDSRNSMGNKIMTHVFFTIAHKLQDKAEASGGNLGGIVICPILVQSWRAVDLRLRDVAMFTVFKGWDDFGCKYYDIDQEIQDELMDWKIGSGSFTDYEARTHAFVIDIKREGCIIYFDSREPKWKNPYFDLLDQKWKPFPFENITGFSIVKQQKKEFVDYLCSFNLSEMTDTKIKAKLYDKLDEAEEKGECYVKPSHFSEIIIRSKDKYESIAEKQNIQEKVSNLIKAKTILERIEVCYGIRNEKILHLSEISSITKLNTNQISVTISNHPFDFESLETSIGRGYWCLKSNVPSKEEISEYKTQNFEPSKKLLMEEA